MANRIKEWFIGLMWRSNLGRQVEQMMFDQAVEDLESHLVIVTGSDNIIEGVGMTIPPGKSGILLRGNRTMIRNCIVKNGNTGISVAPVI